MNPFRERLKSAGLTQKVVAQKVGILDSTLSKILNRIWTPKPPMAKRIQKATGGLICWTEFFDDPPPAQPSTPAKANLEAKKSRPNRNPAVGAGTSAHLDKAI